MPEFMFSACICQYTSCDFGNIPGTLLCTGSNECLCIEEKFCCAAGEKFPIGVIKDEGFILKLGLPCCTCGLKMPDKLCLAEQACLCMKMAAALPFTGPVSKPVCAICAFSLMPEMGFMTPPPSGGAPPAAEMER